jgi:hypothetical protein
MLDLRDLGVSSRRLPWRRGRSRGVGTSVGASDFSTGEQQVDRQHEETRQHDVQPRVPADTVVEDVLGEPQNGLD